MTALTVRLHFAQSVDGFCADAAGGVGWLDAFEPPGDGADAFQMMADALVMGRGTYDQVRGFAGRGIRWPYAGKRCFVLTGRPLEDAPPPGVQAVPDLDGLLARLRQRGGAVWLVGGPATVRGFLDAGALDEIEVFIVPVLLGRGLSMLGAASGHGLIVLEQETYRNGMVRLLYGVRPSSG